ncbi:hypothetical protein P152DRAFT_412254 [Eremomyces bilateralis CBS 781.70]|uniref:DUF6604 domain-containing protein n=1 Tax=Eremomyces bilateralis CBS 781.70 TaxID=1392243 RepID=A0A6G1GB25_9PEZI|nr:uncharacterized protein P152DRAFT_412254 [Eremomyces bilateralis CBS 781.70]KAF1815110.1 hypothetical protein P152DRAFT_412254 [Eremomyces bilateralis CBS 781.70]
MIHTSNKILESSNLQISESINNTGQIAISSFVPVSKLIAQHVNLVPLEIYRLFQSIIAARKATHEAFVQIVSRKPDPEIERSNTSHKLFIDVLTEAFHVLGGDAWIARQKAATEPPDEEDLDQAIFANQFSILGLGGKKEEEEEEEEEKEADDTERLDGPSTNIPTRQQQKKSKGSRKHGKRRQKSKKNPQPAVKEPSLEEVPLESYRIIEDESGLLTDYLMAVYSLVRQWIDLRNSIQSLWRQVSYGGLNSAVAGEMSNIAIGMIEQSELSIFVDFPGHDSYETVMNTITRGNVENAQGMFHAALHRVEPDGKSFTKVQEMDLDVKEQFLVHTYQALLDFVTDFQATRSGKPTKRLLSEIRNWDPALDLQRATKEQRIKWRRAYTINWLYDLVNVFSSIVVQRITMKHQRIALENVDWSTSGPWNEHRRLFGLNEFAGEITALAMQKPRTGGGKKILPHTVFQLQCIVDSLTVSRGWSFNCLKGHLLYPPARAFRPRRDVDLFMDRENVAMGRGFCNGVDVLNQFFEKDAKMHGNPNRHRDHSELLTELRYDFINWLGESKYMYGLTTIPPSRFSNTTANGLWEYSPFLCGVGLMEALELAYAVGLLIMDRIPEPMCVIHLHNMLVQKGYISEPVGLYASLQSLFPEAFFADGQIPTSDFATAFTAALDKSGSRRATVRRQTSRAAARTAFDIHGILDTNANRFFKKKSILRLYREADWIPERIPDENIPVLSILSILRIGQMKHPVDPATGKKVLKNTTLVRRARAEGLHDDAMIEMSALIHKGHVDQELTEAFLSSRPKDYSTSGISKPTAGGNRSKIGLSDAALLDLLKLDIINDVSGQQPVSSLNYIWTTAMFMVLFHRIEDKLEKMRHPLWIQAYEADPKMRKERRASLTGLMLATEDEECLKVMAELFQTPRSGFMQHIYWEDLCTSPTLVSKDPLDDDEGTGAVCTVM